MFTSRVRSWSPVAVLLGMLLVVAGLGAPAQAASTRSLTLHASPTIVGAGASVTFAGTMTNTPVGSSLKLQIRAGTTWLDARNLKTTTAGGAYKTSVVMPSYLGKYYFRTYATSAGGRSAATSNTVTVTVLHKVSASLKPSRTSVSAGDLVTFNGHVSPCKVGATVTLQRYTGAGWTKVTTATLSTQCTFVRVVRPTATTTYRLFVPMHGNYAPAYSSNVKITYNGPAPTPPTITTASLPDGSTGTAYDQTLTKTGQAGTWTKTSGSLPNGITLTASTGHLTGTPTVGGTFNFTVRYTETASGLAASKALSITIVSGPAITTPALPDGKRGDAYSFTLTKTGAAGTWSAANLPNGINLDVNTGQLSGTPIVEGDFAVDLTYTETVSGKHADKQLALHIATSPPPVITTTTLPPGVKSTAYSQQLSKTGNAGTWTVTAGALPPGVTLDQDTGTIAGTPSGSDDYIFTVTFTETAAKTSDSQDLVLHVSPASNSPSITTTTLPDGTAGTAYNATVTGDSIGTWSITKFSLPPGLSINGFNGQITGTPTTPGDYLFQVTYSAVNGSNTKLLKIHVG